MLQPSLILTLHPLIALQVIDLDRLMPYTSHPPMGLLGIASVASLVSDVLVKNASRKVSTTGMRKDKGLTGLDLRWIRLSLRFLELSSFPCPVLSVLL
uniref:Uncharacterized protein n=1 Tax=Tanacetum cinerariifolium TaxID=118510 RepID=A0A6L2LDQ9_TANCI|nr:hypothetical protein [Tanacetum cinerariifolium]